MTLIVVVDVYGRKSVVAKEDLENVKGWPRTIPLRNLQGVKLSRLIKWRPGKRIPATSIHRENIARVMEL